MWQCGEFVYEPGKLEPVRSFTSRDLGIEAMENRLLHHCIHTDPDGAGPAPGEPCVGRRDPRAKSAAIVEPLPLPIRSRRDDHRRGSHIPGPIRNYRNLRVTVVLQPPRVTEGAAAGRLQVVIGAS